jgi:hypothetical protein
MYLDSFPQTDSIVSAVTTTDEIKNKFNEIVYDKVIWNRDT